MPEGHTIHRLARDMGELSGQSLRATSPQGRFAEGATMVDRAVLEHLDAHGKHLFLHAAAGNNSRLGPDPLRADGHADVAVARHCRDCDAKVVTSRVGGRTAYHCPVEQPT